MADDMKVMVRAVIMMAERTIGKIRLSYGPSSLFLHQVIARASQTYMSSCSHSCHE